MNIFSSGSDDDIYVGENRFYNFREAAKIIGIKGLGSVNLFKKLRGEGILDKWNKPTKEFENSGFFKTANNRYLTPLISTYGINYIKKNVLKP